MQGWAEIRSTASGCGAYGRVRAFPDGRRQTWSVRCSHRPARRDVPLNERCRWVPSALSARPRLPAVECWVGGVQVMLLGPPVTSLAHLGVPPACAVQIAIAFLLWTC